MPPPLPQQPKTLNAEPRFKSMQRMRREARRVFDAQRAHRVVRGAERAGVGAELGERGDAPSSVEVRPQASSCFAAPSARRDALSMSPPPQRGHAGAEDAGERPP